MRGPIHGEKLETFVAVDFQTNRLVINLTGSGATPLRGQEQSTHYFAKLSPRVNRYMSEAREKMWELGISIHCTHNEVAPGQHEISPIFNLANLAADTNVLAMEVLHDLAFARCCISRRP